MKIELDPKKTVQQNAAEYFEKAKKLRRKAEGAKEALARFATKLRQAEKKEAKAEAEKPKKKRTEPLRWYEKFRWFISSEGYLCIGGRDATTNEIIIKKHTDKEDVVFHTEAPGSPFFVVKTEGKTPGETTLQEAATACVTYSKAWKLGVTSTEVYSVSPEQISKTAESGEYLVKGGFMIRGKREYYQVSVDLAIGKLEDGLVMGGPRTAVREHCKDHVLVQQGKAKPSDCAKKIAKYLDADVDDVLRALPAGGGQVKLPTGQDLK